MPMCHSSLHDEDWFSDSGSQWGGRRPRILPDEDAECDRLREQEESLQPELDWLKHKG